MDSEPVSVKIDAVTVRVPDIHAGLRFYRDALGHRLLWRNDAIHQAGLAMPGSDTEIVLTTEHGTAPNWLVSSVDDAVGRIEDAGGQTVQAPRDIPVGRVAVVTDPFGNQLVVLDLSRGTYVVDADGSVAAVAPDPAARASPGAESPEDGGALRHRRETSSPTRAES